jgi:hypothetical protein
MLGNIVASRCMALRPSQLADSGYARVQHASLAKAFCTARMRKTTGWARELMAATESSSNTTAPGSSQTPKRSTPTKAPRDQLADRRAVDHRRGGVRRQTSPDDAEDDTVHLLDERYLHLDREDEPWSVNVEIRVELG